MKLELELEKESDGRWLAEFTRFPGALAYGPSKEEAIWNAAKVLIESEQASPTPELEPGEFFITRGDGVQERCRYVGTPKGTK